MKLNYPLAALAAALVLAGCEQTRQAKQLTPEAQAAITAATAEKQREAKAAMDNLNTYLAEQRALFVADMRANLKDMDQKLAGLAETITSLEENAFAEEQLNSLRELRSQLDTLLDDLTKSGPESWHDTKRVIESVWADLRLACKIVKATYES